MRKKTAKENLKPDSEFFYNGEVARWWLQRSLDGSHGRAYRNIADFIADSYVRAPKLIVDYACGAGNLLSLLSYRFPNSRLVGLDGSALLLDRARLRFSRLPHTCSQRISLIETELPNLDLMQGQADLVIFCFPNMMPFSEEDGAPKSRLHLNRAEWILVKRLASENPGALEWSRTISYNLRQMVPPNGICVRVEYAATHRHDLSSAELQQVAFEEGSLDNEVEGQKTRQWFRVLASAYFRSRVMEDVYQQTDDERDRIGGYWITVLRAVEI